MSLTTTLASTPSIEDAVRFPVWLPELVLSTGLTVLLIGVMAYTSGSTWHRRRWGRWLFLWGCVLTIVGANFLGFIALVKYAIP